PFASVLFRFFNQEPHSKKRRVAFVHMKAFDIFVPECTQHFDSANPQDHLLTKPVMGIAAIEKMGQCSIPVGVLRKIGIQKINWHFESPESGNHISPRSEAYR